MTTKIRQPGSSYSQRSLVRARKALRDPKIALGDFGERHGVKRTTLLGWRKKVSERRPLRRKGAPLKISTYNQHSFLAELLTRDGFLCAAELPAALDEPMTKRTAQRYLHRWGIEVAPDLRPHDINDGRQLLLRRQEWIQPEDSVYEDHKPLHGVLWLLSNRRGLCGFMLTENSDDALAQVSAALERKMTPRHRLQTDCQAIADRVIRNNPRRKVTVASG